MQYKRHLENLPGASAVSTVNMTTRGDCSCSVMPLYQTQLEETLIQLMNQREKQLSRTNRFLVAALLFLVTLLLALLLLVVFGNTHRSSNCQPISPVDHLSAAAQQQQEEGNPSALLTGAAKDNKTEIFKIATLKHGTNTARNRAVSNNSNESKYIQWEHKEGNARLRGSFRYSRGDLVVPREGYYRIYLQITYENHDSFCDEGQLQLVLSHSVLIFQESYPMDTPLMSSSYTVNCNTENWKKSLYTGAVFHLKTNDRLRVSSTNPELIALKEDQVFFGADLEPQ